MNMLKVIFYSDWMLIAALVIIGISMGIVLIKENI